jgi:hypothetical protein
MGQPRRLETIGPPVVSFITSDSSSQIRDVREVFSSVAHGVFHASLSALILLGAEK